MLPAQSGLDTLPATSACKLTSRHPGGILAEILILGWRLSMFKLVKFCDFFKVLFAISICSALAACAAIGTAVSHADLETQTLMSNTIFLSPEANQVRPTVYMMVTNTTDKPDFKIKSRLISDLRKKGYQVVSNAKAASYLLQVNILQVGMNSETAAKEMMGTGYGGTLEGITTGTAIAAQSGGGLVVGGIAGGIATSITDNLVKNVTYSVISDVKLVQRVGSKKTTNKTRVLSLAQQVNLKFKKAMPKLELDLSNSLSGLFIERSVG